MKIKELTPKVQAVYDAVEAYYREGTDLNSLTVAEITGRAGIGKGTAYDYFSNKEDMIANALFYKISQICTQINLRMQKEKSLSTKIKLILMEMEHQLAETDCLFRAIHIMSGDTEIGKRLQEMEKNKREEEIMPMDLIRYIVQDGLADREKPGQETLDYLSLDIFSKILCYGMFLHDNSFLHTRNNENMQKMVCEGILREVEAVTASLA